MKQDAGALMPVLDAWHRGHMTTSRLHELISGWTSGVDFRVQEWEEWHPPAPVCHECNQELSEVVQGNESAYVGRLRVTFDGGYGEYIDPPHPITVALCVTCATKMLDRVPKIREFVISESF